jgi:anti-sigma factor RsiW
MRELNQRPACHRAEDLVTYLYGEAGEAEALDFRAHLQQCDACRTEFALFNQVHESIVTWRNDALGSLFNAVTDVSEPAVAPAPAAPPERKLSGLAALREFFNVSPLWLRGATGFAGLLLGVLLVLTIARSWQRTPPVANVNHEPKVYTQSEFKAELARQVKVETEKLQTTIANKPKEIPVPPPRQVRPEAAPVRTAARPRMKGLTVKEREQLAADLRLIPTGDDDEFRFLIWDQPNQ